MLTKLIAEAIHDPAIVIATLVLAVVIACLAAAWPIRTGLGVGAFVVLSVLFLTRVKGEG